MLVDVILDRKDGFSYSAKEMYYYCSERPTRWESDLASAIDGGTEQDVKRVLCDYICANNYSLEICEYINSVDWLVDEYGNKIA